MCWDSRPLNFSNHEAYGCNTIELQKQNAKFPVQPLLPFLSPNLFEFHLA